MESKIEEKELMIKLISAVLPEAKIYLYGSYARGDNGPGSDIDIALDAGRRLTLGELALAGNVIRSLPIVQKIDVVCMHRIPEEMKQVILREGVLWKG